MVEQSSYRKTISLFLLQIMISSFGFLFAQNPSRHFMDIFEKETHSDRSMQFGHFINVEQLSFFPDTLPSWFFNPPVSSPQKVYAVGISDPDLTADDAFEQALYRAKVLAVLYNTSTIEYFRDVFTSVKDDDKYLGYRQRFDTYFKITASQPASKNQFLVIDQHLTRYNESIVLVSFNPKPKTGDDEITTRISAIASMLYIEAQVGDAFEPQSAFDLISEIRHQDDIYQTASYTIIQKGNREQTRSMFKDQEIRYPMFVYRYSNPSWKAYTKPLVCHAGLWGAYMQQMLQHLTLTTEQNNIHLRSLGQQTEPEATELAREVSSKSMRIKLLTVDFSEKNIIFDITLE